VLLYVVISSRTWFCLLLPLRKFNVVINVRLFIKYFVGDSGGPLACQRSDSCDWYLAGITSFGKGCGLAGYYGVYTNVLNYDVWIRRNLGVEASKLCTRTQVKKYVTVNLN